MNDRKFTGYNDANNKPIFEGDIIHDLHYVGQGKRNHYYEVVFKDDAPGMVKIHDRNNFTDFEDFTFSSEVVIGNKFENADLLK